MSDFEYVTGGQYASIYEAPMTQERIDAMDLCKICARIQAFHAKEDNNAE